MKKILIVDDEEDMLWTLGNSLCHDGFQADILTAASGEEALGILDKTAVDLVVTDINMPGMNGIELLVEIKNRRLEAGVIVMTAYPSRQVKTDALLHGGLHFVEKPFDIRKLRQSIAHALSGNLFRGPVSGIQLADIIQINCLANATSSLRIKAPEGAGLIYTVAGKIVHALCDDLTGEEAFHRIMAFTGGTIENIKIEAVPETTITRGVEPLLIEATRRIEAAPLPAEQETNGSTPRAGLSPLPTAPPDLTPAERQQEFNGIVTGMHLSDIIQINALAATTSRLKITSGDQEGIITIVNGDVVHAECPDCRGEEAFFRIMGFSGGRIESLPLAESAETTIEIGFEALLLESAKRTDEEAEAVGRETEEHLTSGTSETHRRFSAARVRQGDGDGSHPPPDKQHIMHKENTMAELQELLVEFTNIPGVNTVCLVGRDGFLLDSMAPQGIDSEMIGAIASGGFGASESMGNQLAKGQLMMTMIEYESGPVMLSPIGDEAFLVIVAEKESNLGMIRLKIKKHAKEIQSVASI